jgi:hypothetical protein
MDMLSFGEQHYLDDRMFVVDVEPVRPAEVEPAPAPSCWAVTTRWNIPGFAIFRRGLFESRDQAIAVLRTLAPRTPRLSLDGLSPIPAPTFEQHNEWLREQGLSPLEY